MNSWTSKPDYDKAAELAKAMRSGIDDYRSMPVTTGHSRSFALTDLAGYSDLRSLPPLAKRDRITWPIVRALRSLLRTLLRPWLAVQTEFNQGVMTELDDLRRRIAELESVSSPGAMPVGLHRHGTAEDMPSQSQGHSTLDSSPPDAMPLALPRHKSKESQAIS